MNDIKEKAKLVRKWCLVSTTEAGSGHPTSCLSAADIGTVLFDTYFSYDLQNPLNLNNDHFILSKGHAAPLFYTLFAMSGAFPLEDLKTLRKFTSPLEGHPTPNFKYTDAATGSLGQGLSVGAGLAYGVKYEIRSAKSADEIRNSPKVYVLLGDGELAEGQVWEAANFASHYKLDNLVAILDINRLAQSQETMFGHHIEEYMNRFRAFGFEVIAIDGHNYQEIDAALKEATENTTGKPYAIIAKTFKGKGISFLENKDGWHGKALKKDDLEKALKELGSAGQNVDDSLRFTLRKPAGPASHSSHRAPASLASAANADARDGSPSFVSPAAHPSKLEERSGVGSPLAIATPSYKMGEEIATREVYGEVLAKLGDIDEAVFALDGDVKNSTFSQDFLKKHPERFIECFIAEQNMVSVAVGLSRLQKKPFVSTFAAFFTHAFDQIRMAALSKANIRFCGSHVGVSIGEDGASQMGLEDIAMFGALPDSIIFHPSDAVSTRQVMSHMLSYDGISYLRTLRPKTPVLYESDEEFVIGGSKILRSAQDDILTIVAAGITVHEALKAYEILLKDNIKIRIVDCYSIKPIDKEGLKKSLESTRQSIIITVEDHFEHGGLGDFVLEAVSDTGGEVHKMAVDHISRSGTKDELLSDAEIDAQHIVEKVKELASPFS